MFFHVIIHTFSSSLPIPPPTSNPCHLHISTGRHPIIHFPTLQMPKPTQSATPRYIHHTLYFRKIVQILAAFYPSATPHTSTPSSPDYADYQPSSPMFQSHMSIHFTRVTQPLDQLPKTFVNQWVMERVFGDWMHFPASTSCG